MFNLFRNKHKRSDWLEGLLEAENLVLSGFDFEVVEERGSGVEITFKKDYTTYKISKLSAAKWDFLDGILTYLDYYENNLKKSIDFVI